MRRRVVTLVALLALVAGGAVVLPPTASAETATVSAAAFTFVPPVATLEAGDTLVFNNADVAPHDLTGVDGGPAFTSGNVPGGQQAEVAGVADLPPGTYQFFCTLHPWMNGVLNVRAPDGGPAFPPAPPDGPGGGAVVVAPGNAVPTPSSLTVFDGSLYVASYAQGTVYQAPILEGGALGPATPYADGFTNPLGVAFDESDGTLFVADSHASTRAGRTAGRVRAVPAGGGTPELVIDELPNGRHNTNGMAVHGGRLYITNGNSTDDGLGEPPEEALSGTLLSVDVGARNIVVPPNGVPPEARVEAVGMRNLYDVAFRPGTDEAWIPMNGLDAQDPWGEDLLLKADVADGDTEDFGFPGCVYRATPDGMEVGQNQNPEVPDTCDGSQAPAEQLLGLHTSADGLAFGPDGNLYVARFGNFFGSAVVGHDIVQVPVDANGVSGPPEVFLRGGLPLDVTFGPDGMYIADFSGALLFVPNA